LLTERKRKKEKKNDPEKELSSRNRIYLRSSRCKSIEIKWVIRTEHRIEGEKGMKIVI